MLGYPAGVWGRFLLTALVWTVPAILLLPFLLILAIAAVGAADGSILEMGGWIRGRVLTALGPVLILAGGALLMWAATSGGDPADGVMVVGVGLLGVAVGGYLTRRALRRVAAEHGSGP